eukprot:gene26974-38344_t
MEYHPQSAAYESSLEALNAVFVFIFVAEAGLKLLAFGPRGYFRRGNGWNTWNCFDFSIAFLSFVGFIINRMSDQSSPLVSIFRILRLTRILRMMKRTQGLQRIIHTLFLSIPALLNVTSLITLLFFIYAVLGVQLFARTRRGSAMGAYANFENFGHSILMLLRMATGEDWQAVLDNIMAREPDCEPKLGDCGNYEIAPVYCCTFTMCGTYILINLIVAVILDNFGTTGSGDDPQLINRAYVDTLKRSWARHAVVTPEHPDGALAKDKLELFLREIGPPLGPAADVSEKGIMFFTMGLDMRLTHDGVIPRREALLKFVDDCRCKKLDHALARHTSPDGRPRLFSLTGRQPAPAPTAHHDQSLSSHLAAAHLQAQSGLSAAAQPLLPPSAARPSSPPNSPTAAEKDGGAA